MVLLLGGVMAAIWAAGGGWARSQGHGSLSAL